VERVAPKPPIATEGPVIKNTIKPAHLDQQVTPSGPLFVLAHVAVPRVSADTWTLEICGLVRQTLSVTLNDLMRYPQHTVESIHKCAGNPFEPTQPSRQIANVVWQGVDLQRLLDDAGVDSSATYLWSYGLDYGEFFGNDVTHYVKDLPLSRIEQGDVLIAHTLNGAPLSIEHGFPTRLVVPGFYGTNSVKWICRLELADRRAEGLFTTELYNDLVEGGGTKPVWEVEPESVFVFPQPDATLSNEPQKIWGRAWSSSEIVSVEVSFDGGRTWRLADVTPRHQRAWQTFSIDWPLPSPGKHRLQCRATDADGRTQPLDGARNAVYSVDIATKSI
jgi:DMSO/TMAO reductase YedYZ molybdopterin-dependent catalytic subunit